MKNKNEGITVDTESSTPEKKTVISGKFTKLGGIGLVNPTPNSTHTGYGDYGVFKAYSGNGIKIKTPNTYPQALANLINNSPIHGAAIQKKGIYTVGQGVDFDLLDNPELEVFLNSLNDEDESISLVLRQVAFDLVSFGGFALRIVWSEEGTINQIYHEKFQNVRKGASERNRYGRIKMLDYVISNNWAGENNNKDDVYIDRVKAFNPDKISLPIEVNGNNYYDDDSMENSDQLIYYVNSQIGSSEYYPIPDYAGCLDSSYTHMNTILAQNNALTNGVNGIHLVSIKNDSHVDDVQAEKIVHELNDAITGPQNAGNLVTLPCEVEVKRLEPQNLEEIEKISPGMIKNIISAHQIPAILLGIQEGTGFSNNGDEMKVALEQYQKTHIKHYQQCIIGVFNSILGYVLNSEPTNELGFNLTIKPFSYNEDQGGSVTTDDQSTLN